MVYTMIRLKLLYTRLFESLIELRWKLNNALNSCVTLLTLAVVANSVDNQSSVLLVEEFLRYRDGVFTCGTNHCDHCGVVH